MAEEHLQSTNLISPEARQKIDAWLAKFPADQRQSALLAALHIVQDENDGWLSEVLLDAVADYLQIPKIQVYGVATFYDMYDLKKVGKHKIRVCTNIACMLRGSDQVTQHLQQKLGIKFGETTQDGKFTLKEVECLAACNGAPMMAVDETYHGNLTPEKIDQILEKLD